MLRRAAVVPRTIARRSWWVRGRGKGRGSLDSGFVRDSRVIFWVVDLGKEAWRGEDGG